jgi:hypothetical protein
MFTPFAFVQTGGSPYGPLTTAFLAASGITGSTYINALNDFEIGMSTYGLTGKMKLVYPLLGGDIATAKWNFMNPANTDAAGRLVVSGSVNIGTNGISGSNADTGVFAGLNTNISPNDLYTDYGDNNNHHSLWIVTNPNPFGPPQQIGTPILYPAEIGAVDQGAAQYYTNVRYYASNTSKTINLSEGGGRFITWTTNPTSTVGFWCSTRSSSTDLYFYRNQAGTTQSQTNATVETSTLSGFTNNITLCTVGTASSNRQIGFVTVGSKLTNAQVTDLYTIVSAFASAVGR